MNNRNIVKFTRYPAELIVGQIIGDQSGDMGAHAIPKDMNILRPRASRMIPQVPHQLRDTSRTEIWSPLYLRETGLAYQRTVINDNDIVIASSEVR